MLRTAFINSKRSFSSTSAARAQAFARAQLLGRVGQEITESESSSGVKYARYPIAVQVKRDGPTSWFNVIAFNEQQINYMTEYVKKG
ncbi:CYFA0S22e01948g1_1 [Cyberlindnera fabianii]|nr:CYFA0S22e01948g1_1 [Cyberlindnera fabianii]